MGEGGSILHYFPKVKRITVPLFLFLSVPCPILPESKKMLAGVELTEYHLRAISS